MRVYTKQCRGHRSKRSYWDNLFSSKWYERQLDAAFPFVTGQLDVLSTNSPSRLHLRVPKNAEDIRLFVCFLWPRVRMAVRMAEVLPWLTLTGCKAAFGLDGVGRNRGLLCRELNGWCKEDAGGGGGAGTKSGGLGSKTSPSRPRPSGGAGINKGGGMDRGNWCGWCSGPTLTVRRNPSRLRGWWPWWGWWWWEGVRTTKLWSVVAAGKVTGGVGAGNSGSCLLAREDDVVIELKIAS